ncbi:glycosyltransferase family 2 protein [Patescibacteria group bacterium]|nr:glycosyltransferase family 2 protein [Patescibacteria group bacterium]
MLDLSVIIVNFNGRGLLRQCLKSLLTNLAGSSLKYKALVVDNNSSDGSVDMVREQFPEVRLIPLKENGGYAKAVNVGIKSIESRYYLILNMDTTIVQKEALDKMVIFMDNHPQVGLAGPKLINPNGSTQVSTCVFPKFTYPIYRRTFLSKMQFTKKAIRDYLMLDWDHKDSMAVDWVIGTGLLVRNEAIQQIGLMDERFFMYFEDVDWCRRMWDSGWQVFYIADIEIVHYYSRDSAKQKGFISLFSKITRIHIASWLKYFMKYSGKNQIHAAQKEK